MKRDENKLKSMGPKMEVTWPVVTRGCRPKYGSYSWGFFLGLAQMILDTRN
jgi:hypothetical protein